MSLHYSIQTMLDQMIHSAELLTNEQFTYPAGVLSHATIGQHVRHVVEFFLELDKGYEDGRVNYDNRGRDKKIENDRSFAITKLHEVGGRLNRPDKELWLTTVIAGSVLETVEVRTNYQRELLYNLEHMVHHMALIRIGIEAVSVVTLPVEFGVAQSTLQSKKACAQ